MQTAHIITNSVVVARHDKLPDGTECLATNNTYQYDYEGYIAAPDVLGFDGIVFGKSGFDSDKHLIYYRSDKRIATFK